MGSEQARYWASEYGFHNMVIHSIVDGLTHEQSLVQPPFDANCLNWVMGHIIANRSHVLETLGVSAGWQEEIRALYQTGTSPIRPGSEAVAFETLLIYLDESQVLLFETLGKISDKNLAEVFKNYRGEKTRLAHIRGFHWHEAYHIGQLDVLKAMAIAPRVR